MSALFDDPAYFLSSANPLATSDQRDVEDRALRLMQSEAMERARKVVTLLWQSVAAWPTRDQADRFDNMIEEYLFHHAMRAANGDAGNPQISRFMAPPHHWFGRDVPGSRWAGDSPDFIYRTVPIAHGSSYRITGRPSCAEPPTVNYALMADSTAAPVQQALLDSLDMEFAEDGSFVITIDDQPAGTRANHIQTKPGSDFLMIRDALGDWNACSANALRVERIGAKAQPAMGEEAMAARAAKIAIEGVYYTYYCTRSGSGQPPNQIRPPLSAAAFGGMASQLGTKGNLCLEQDEAFVVTASAAGAQFRNVMLTDNFHMSLEYWDHTASLNMTQMQPDADGRFTYVVAHRDPGVHNWIDTCGLKQTIFGHRWQAFARDGSAGTPEFSASLVKLADLEAHLPAGVARIDAEGRKAQIAARKAGYARRFVDC